MAVWLRALPTRSDAVRMNDPTARRRLSMLDSINQRLAAGGIPRASRSDVRVRPQVVTAIHRPGAHPGLMPRLSPRIRGETDAGRGKPGSGNQRLGAWCPVPLQEVERRSCYIACTLQ